MKRESKAIYIGYKFFEVPHCLDLLRKREFKTIYRIQILHSKIHQKNTLNLNLTLFVLLYSCSSIFVLEGVSVLKV